MKVAYVSMPDGEVESRCRRCGDVEKSARRLPKAASYS